MERRTRISQALNYRIDSKHEEYLVVSIMYTYIRARRRLFLDRPPRGCSAASSFPCLLFQLNSSRVRYEVIVCLSMHQQEPGHGIRYMTRIVLLDDAVRELLIASSTDQLLTT